MYGIKLNIPRKSFEINEILRYKDGRDDKSNVYGMINCRCYKPDSNLFLKRMHMFMMFESFLYFEIKEMMRCKDERDDKSNVYGMMNCRCYKPDSNLF